MSKTMKFRNMEEFWGFYVTQHSKPETRRWHFVGTSTSSTVIIFAILFKWWFVLLAPLLAYGCAWYSHFFIEGNVPASFGHPVWSLLCDVRMFALMLTGDMEEEVKKFEVKSPVS